MNDTTIEALREKLKGMAEPMTVMEICGTHTVALFRHGIRDLLPANMRMISGPGCPVCVTPVKTVNQALALAERNDTIITTFGDMIRVPGTKGSLAHAKADGADVRMLYSPLAALDLARTNPDKKVVFLAVGFETTIPTMAVTVRSARDMGLTNFYILCAHKIVPPAIDALLSSQDTAIDGFLLPGHVSAIIGLDPYRFMSEKYGKPGVVGGFEPEEMLYALALLGEMKSINRPGIRNAYPQVVRDEGNPKAVAIMDAVFEPCDTEWRGLGAIPLSGLRLKPEYQIFDAEIQLGIEVPEASDPKGCRCGDVLCGKITPNECPLFGTTCTPQRPVGPCMVSNEGTCSAFHIYGAKL